VLMLSDLRFDGSAIVEMLGGADRVRDVLEALASGLPAILPPQP
jgi:hypothetical protein